MSDITLRGNKRTPIINNLKIPLKKIKNFFEGINFFVYLWHNYNLCGRN